MEVGTGEPDGGASAPIMMHRAPSGLYIELVDRSLRETLFARDLAEDQLLIQDYLYNYL